MAPQPLRRGYCWAEAGDSRAQKKGDGAKTAEKVAFPAHVDTCERAWGGLCWHCQKPKACSCYPSKVPSLGQRTGAAINRKEKVPSLLPAFKVAFLSRLPLVTEEVTWLAETLYGRLRPVTVSREAIPSGRKRKQIFSTTSSLSKKPLILMTLQVS